MAKRKMTKEARDAIQEFERSTGVSFFGAEDIEDGTRSFHEVWQSNVGYIQGMLASIDGIRIPEADHE